MQRGEYILIYIALFVLADVTRCIDYHSSGGRLTSPIFVVTLEAK